MDQRASGPSWSGCRLLSDPIAEAVATAKQADVAIAVVGITSHLEGEEMKVEVPGFKGGDRTSLDLPKEEEDLLEALQATGKPVVVVLMNGSALVGELGCPTRQRHPGRMVLRRRRRDCHCRDTLWRQQSGRPTAGDVL